MDSYLVDSHAHLFMLEHAPLADILKRAEENKIKKMITVSTDFSNWEKNRQLASIHTNLYYSLGLHPHDAHQWKDVGPKLQAAFANGIPQKCVGVGETGLDFHYNLSAREEQITCFEGHLEVAKKNNLPVIIHCRNAFTELYDSVRRVGLGSPGGVMHCFTGDYTEAKEALSLGLKISFSGIVTFKTADALREAAKKIPLEEMLVETDCPFLAPIPMRGKPNEPSYLTYTALCLAELKGVTLDEVSQKTARLTETLFAFADRE